MRDAADTPRDDAGLVRRAREGDPAAFDAIVREHRSVVLAVARRMLGSAEDADEVAQETFVRAWRSLPGFREDASLRTWLVRIAVNAARSAGGRRRAVERIEDLPEPEAPGADAHAGAERDEALRAVRRAAAALPPRQREVVALKVFTDMSYEDVAAAMGISVGAAKAHLHQAVANLRRLLSARGR